jgi:hypothetical protein
MVAELETIQASLRDANRWARHSVRGVNLTATIRAPLGGGQNMANTYTSLHYHIVFSTKNRERWLKVEIEQQIWAYLGGIAKQNKIKPIQIGGTDDHVHLLLGAPAVLAPARITQLIKGGSSAWIHETFTI